jgi:Family of unknown function (DUF5670)
MGPVLKRTDTRPRLRHPGVRKSVDSPPPVWRARDERAPEREITMLYTIAVILLIAWLLGLVGTFTIGPIIHVLLVVAFVLFVVGLRGGRRSLA